MTEQNFTERLLEWYSRNRRDLPWRRTRDPYHIWLSEIILQQTRIEQGLPYYERFVEAFPDIRSLAEAPENEVLRLWQGLGYYSRARYMHETAGTLMTRYRGCFPDDFHSIRKLKGIGDYTAAAIASIAFDRPVAVTDGNVLRFISRYEGIMESVDLQRTRKQIFDLLNRIIPADCPGDFNQALMEFGALICKPSSPSCTDCPFRTDCVAFRLNLTGKLPVKKPRIQPRQRRIHYFVVTYLLDNREMILLNKRTERDIWKNLYDFPSVEPDEQNEEKDTFNLIQLQELIPAATYTLYSVRGPVIHLLSHQRLNVMFYRYKITEPGKNPFIPATIDRLNDFPFPELISRYLSTQTFV